MQDPIAEWNAAIKSKKVEGKSDTDARREVVKENPTLHLAFVQAANEKARTKGRR